MVAPIILIFLLNKHLYEIPSESLPTKALNIVDVHKFRDFRYVRNDTR